MVRRTLAAACAVVLLLQLSLSGVLMACGRSTAEPVATATHHHAPAAPEPGDADERAPAHCLTMSPCVVVMDAPRAAAAIEGTRVAATRFAEPGDWRSVARVPDQPPPKA